MEGPWYDSLENPQSAQQDTLRNLIKGYEQTDYGKRFGATYVDNYRDYQKSFPVTDYRGLAGYLEEVKRGNYSALLPEPVSQWVMTRGTTGLPKIIPTTETHLSQIFSNGARAIVNFALKRDLHILEKSVLNLNFPSEVSVMPTSSGEVKFGYSSGTYAKLFPSLGDTGLVPKQEDIDSLGGGISKDDWERRFELVYDTAKNAPIGSVMGVTPVVMAFAHFLRKKRRVSPKEIWKMRALFCTSVAKIHSRYEPTLKHLFGEAPVVEMYSATEGVFAQQLDSLPYLCPNYDTYLFEVETGNGTKLLHELKPKEWGEIIISSVLFPRYKIGDMVECIGKGYFRVIGRAKRRTVLEHLLYNIFTLRFA